MFRLYYSYIMWKRFSNCLFQINLLRIITFIPFLVKKKKKVKSFNWNFFNYYLFYMRCQIFFTDGKMQFIERCQKTTLKKWAMEQSWWCAKKKGWQLKTWQILYKHNFMNLEAEKFTLQASSTLKTMSAKL